MVAYWYQPVAKAITNGAASSSHTGIDAPATTGKAVAATAATNPTSAAVTIRVAIAVDGDVGDAQLEPLRCGEPFSDRRAGQGVAERRGGTFPA